MGYNVLAIILCHPAKPPSPSAEVGGGGFILLTRLAELLQPFLDLASDFVGNTALLL